MMHLNKQNSGEHWRTWNQIERVAKAHCIQILYFSQGLAIGSIIERFDDQEEVKRLIDLVNAVTFARREQLEAGQ